MNDKGGMGCHAHPLLACFYYLVLLYLLIPNVCRHNDVTMRVPPHLVTSNTIFDVARRGKTLLITPNILRRPTWQRGDSTQQRYNNTHVPHPLPCSKLNARCFPPTTTLSSLETYDRDGMSNLATI